MGNVETAVIMAAGRGARRLPITRAIEKTMLPIGNRPTIDYAVEQCADAGADEIILVVSNEARQLHDYYDGHDDIAKEYPWLERKGKLDIRYMRQGARHGYGTAAPLKAARATLEDRASFAVLAGDNILYRANQNPIKTLAQAHAVGVSAVMLGMEIPRDQTSHFGLIETDAAGQLINFVEKPAAPLDERPPLANISHFLLTPEIFPIIDELPAAADGEYYLPSAVLNLARQAVVRVVPTDGTYLDSGNKAAWVEANRYMLEQNGH